MTNAEDGFGAFARADYRPARHKVSKPSQQLYPTFGKRIMDLSLILIALPALLILIAGLSIILILTQRGSPFFGHPRMGRNGVPFICWKLRTMIPNAEASLQTYLFQNPEAAQEWDANFKLTHDPRVTPIGRILRQTSLDELPQIWNILKGEMSLVGPRPVTKTECAHYGPALRHYHALRPGLTGLWQVQGRNDTSYAERIAMDVDYGSRVSLARDLQILLQTIRTVLTRSGR